MHLHSMLKLIDDMDVQGVNYIQSHTLASVWWTRSSVCKPYFSSQRVPAGYFVSCVPDVVQADSGLLLLL